MSVALGLAAVAATGVLVTLRAVPAPQERVARPDRAPVVAAASIGADGRLWATLGEPTESWMAALLFADGRAWVVELRAVTPGIYVADVPASAPPLTAPRLVALTPRGARLLDVLVSTGARE